MTTMTEEIEQVRDKSKTTVYTEPLRLWLYHQFDVFNDAEAVDELVSAYSPDWLTVDDDVVWQVIDGRGNVEVMSDEDFKRRSILHALHQNKKHHLGYREAGLYCYIDAVMYDRMNDYKHYSMKEDNQND